MANISFNLNHEGQFPPEDALTISLFTVIGRSVSFFLNELKKLLLRYPGSSIYLQVIVWPLQTPNDVCPNSRNVTIDFSANQHGEVNSSAQNFCLEGFYREIEKAAQRASRRCLTGQREIGMVCNIQIRSCNAHGFVSGLVFNKLHRKGLHLCTG